MYTSSLQHGKHFAHAGPARVCRRRESHEIESRAHVFLLRPHRFAPCLARIVNDVHIEGSAATPIRLLVATSLIKKWTSSQTPEPSIPWPHNATQSIANIWGCRRNIAPKWFIMFGECDGSLGLGQPIDEFFRGSLEKPQAHAHPRESTS